MLSSALPLTWMGSLAFPCVRLATTQWVSKGSFRQWCHINPKVRLLLAGLGCQLEGFVLIWLAGLTLEPFEMQQQQKQQQ